MRQIDDTHERFLSTSTDAPGSTIAGGQAYLADVARRLAPYFARSQSRDRVLAYLRGLLSEAERKNSWQVAEVCGETTPYGFQYLLSRADWDADAVRDELRTYSMQHLGDPNGVLVLDETGFLKKGRHSAGVARQYSGTVGKVDNCQIGVFLSYASPLGQVLLDRELYVPQEWTDDRERCRQAGIPEERRFATKPQLAQQMLARAFAAGVPAKWVTGDSVYGHDRRLRLWLEAQRQAYVLAVSGQEYVWSHGRQQQVKTLLATLPEDGWTRLSAGDGAKGPRWYHWRWLPLAATPGAGLAPLVAGPAQHQHPHRADGLCDLCPASQPLWKRWCGWRASAGRWRAALRRRRAKWAWISMRCGAGRPGIGISRSPCGRWPC